MNIFTKVFLLAVLSYCTYCAILYFLQRQIMYPRHHIEPVRMADNTTCIEKNWIKTAGGKVETWFLPPLFSKVKGPYPAIIFAHGNGELIDFWPEEFEKLTRHGIGVLLVEYPGYGRSEGNPSQATITETMAKAYDILVARKDIDSSKIVLFGRSLGGGAVCSLASIRPSAALILMSTFTSAGSMAFKYRVPGFIVRDPYDNLEVVKNYQKDILIIHGRQDTTIPYSHGMVLYQAAKHGKMISYDCGHNDCPPEWNMFKEDLIAFFYDKYILRTLDVNDETTS